jgi:hypothetical protein
MKQLILSLLLSLLLLLGLDSVYPQPGYSLLKEQQESQGQMLYQARHSLRDSRGRSWQVVLFKRIKMGEVKNLHLRLVGFPDQVRFIHPGSLKLSTAQGEVFLAGDVFAAQAPAPNVGEYEMKDILPHLFPSKSLELNLPLEQPETIAVPLPVLLEWQTLIPSPTE